MNRKEQIKGAYKQLGGSAGFYDGMMTYSTLPDKAICRLVWNMNGSKNLYEVGMPIWKYMNLEKGTAGRSS